MSPIPPLLETIQNPTKEELNWLNSTEHNLNDLVDQKWFMRIKEELRKHNKSEIFICHRNKLKLAANNGT